MTKRRPDLIFCYNTIFSIVIQWKFRSWRVIVSVNFFIYYLLFFIYLLSWAWISFWYVRNIHGDGTVRSRSRERNFHCSSFIAKYQIGPMHEPYFDLFCWSKNSCLFYKNIKLFFSLMFLCKHQVTVNHIIRKYR